MRKFGKPGKPGKKRRRSSFDTIRFDEEDLLELDEEWEFIRPDADQIEDEEDDDEDEEEPIEDLAESLDADTYDRAGAEESLTEEAEQEADEEELLTDEEVRSFTQEFEKIPEDITDLEAGEKEKEPEEYDAYEEEYYDEDDEDEYTDPIEDEEPDRPVRSREREREHEKAPAVKPAERSRRERAADDAPRKKHADKAHHEHSSAAGHGKKHDRRERTGRHESGSKKKAAAAAGRKKEKGKIKLTVFEWTAIVMSVILVFTAVSLGMMVLRVRKQTAQVEAYGRIGADLTDLKVIGESGLIAMRDAAALRLALQQQEEEEEEPAEEPEEPVVKEEIVEVQMNLTTIKKDLKIKFVNSATGKLVPNLPFTVEAKAPDGKTSEWKDDDGDGIIYRSDIAAGVWSVTPKALEEAYSERFRLDLKPKTASVKDTIAYKKVDVTDEIKKESQINVAAEDTQPKEAAAVESVNVDTVEWVESSVEEVADDSAGTVYSKVEKSEIVVPGTTARLKLSDIVRFAEVLQTLSLSVPSSTIRVGESCSLTPIPSGFTEEPACTYASSDTAIATVSSDGKVTGVSVGTVTITATAVSGEEKATATCEITVEAEKPTISLSEKTAEMTVGDSKTFTVKATGYQETPTYVWKSSDESVATVTDGTVKAVSAGRAEITVTAGEESATLEVTVKEPEEQTERKLTVTPAKLVLSVGKTGTLSASHSGYKDPEVTYTSGDTAIATVSDSGTVTAVKAGKTKVTVTVTEKGGAEKKTAECEITVADGRILKTKNGETVYVKDGDGYREATVDDYESAETFYLQKSNKKFIYHGWQTIDGSTYFYDKNGKYVTGEQTILGVKYHFSAEGILSKSDGVLGVDVSKWNGNIDWTAVKNSGVTYAIIRCGYRGTATGVLVEDPSFRTYIQGAQKAGLKVGAYFFSAAVNDVEAVEEASMAASLCSGYKLSYPVFLDVEKSSSGNGRADHISKADRTAVIRAFCETMSNSGYRTGLYSNKTWMEEMIDTPSLTGYKLWLAQYAAQPSYTRTRYDMWQYTSKGKIAGISGNTDLNISYLGY